jgi:hypothetical protein
MGAGAAPDGAVMVFFWVGIAVTTSSGLAAPDVVLDTRFVVHARAYDLPAGRSTRELRFWLFFCLFHENIVPVEAAFDVPP